MIVLKKIRAVRALVLGLCCALTLFSHSAPASGKGGGVVVLPAGSKNPFSARPGSVVVFPSGGKNRVNVHPKDTPVKRLPGGVSVIGGKDSSKIVIAPKHSMPPLIGAPSENAAEEFLPSDKVGIQHFVATTRFAFIPLNSYGTAAPFRLLDAATGKVILEAKGVLAPLGDTPDWYMEVDISAYKNSELIFSYDRNGGRAAPLRFSNNYPQRKWLQDFSRPAFHFSPRVGKLMGVGPLTYFDNNWFAMYMFDPFSITGQNLPHTGRAVSDNLMRWSYLPSVETKLDSTGRMDRAQANSFVDLKNRSALFNGLKGGVVFVRNVEGFGDCLSFTTDMQNFYASAQNPIIKKPGKNPFIFYDEDLKKWVLLRVEAKDGAQNVKPKPAAERPKKMRIDLQGGSSPSDKKGNSADGGNADIYSEIILANSSSEKGEDKPSQPVDYGRGSTEVAIYAGASLRNLERVGAVDADFPSAQLFKMPVAGVPNPPQWVLLSGDGRYYVGSFDGKAFVPFTGAPQRLFNGNFEDLKLWQNVPGGRRVVSARFVNPPFKPKYASEVVKFDGAFTAPYELSLVQIHNGTFQLRAALAQEFKYSTVLPTDAVGWSGSMTFENNSFMLPDACGHKRVFEGIFDLSANSHMSLDVGRYGIGYTKDENKFKISEGDYEVFDFISQTSTDKNFFNFQMLLDTPGVEFISNAGRDVIVVGDNFFNPDYEIRLLSVGGMGIYSMVYFSVLYQPVKYYAPSTLGVYEKIVYGLK